MASKNIFPRENKPPSELFIKTVLTRGFGSPVIDCCCGRTNYASNDQSMEEGEFERLEKKRKKHPERYVLHPGNDDCVSSVEISGRTYVLDCPCNGLSDYEQFLNDRFEGIADFFRKKKKQLEARAKALEGFE
jgi:hypothetical protein